MSGNGNVVTRSTKAVINFTAFFIFLALFKTITLLCGVDVRAGT